MAIAMLAWILAIPLLGFVTGLRTMTSFAVLCWFAYFGYLSVDDTWAFWTAKLVTVVIITLCALGEYIADKLPNTPNRTAPVGLIARLLFGGLTGATAATGLGGSAIEGIILGSLGAILGAFVGFHFRRSLVERTGWPDWVVALGEDAVAIVCAVVAMGIVTG
jgi:uncharacterized membrane protein